MKIDATLRGIRTTPGRIAFYLLEIRDEMGEIPQKEPEIPALPGPK
jgi:hypothetical protein